MPGLVEQFRSIRTFWLFFAKRLRLSNPWNYKVPFLITVPYLVYLIGDSPVTPPLYPFLASVSVIIGVAGIGYLTNDLGDRKKDELADKENASADLSVATVFLLFLFFFILSLLPWLYLPFSKKSFYLLCFQFLLFFLYAFPPFRLKEKNVLGLIADTLYAHVNPALLAAYTFYQMGFVSFQNFIFLLWPLLAWQLVLGLRNIVFHQLKDQANDLASGTRTFVTSVGEKRSSGLCKHVLLPLEFLLFLVFVSAISTRFPVFAIFVFVYWPALFLKTGAQFKQMNYRERAYLFLDDLYVKWLPFFVLFLLCSRDQKFWPVLLLHFLLFRSDAKSFLIRRFSRNSATGESETNTHQAIHLAIVSTNRAKYSETFIHAHATLLPAKVHLLFNGYLPEQYHDLQGGRSGSLKGYGKSFFDRLFGREVDLNTGLENYLLKNKIHAILCEYGPSGVAIMEVAKKLSIPLTVHFHGYDAYRNDVLSSHGKNYPQLFDQAAGVIAVSAHMLGQLQVLGCPPEKLHWLPYGVDTALFKPEAATPKEFTFVACGRFVQKKAPDLTIRAFAKVLAKVPDAKLVMIGDGEMLGFCEVLTAKLGLKHAVEFKGVLAPAEVAQVFNRSLIFVQHSLTTGENDSEGTPLAILEAGACGLPVVSTRHGGIMDVVVENETGFLGEERNVEAMAEKMTALALDLKMVSKMGTQASKRILARYSQKEYLHSLWEVIKETL